MLLTLRFGAQDPQAIMDALRCAMRHIRKQYTEEQVCMFLLSLRTWHNGLTDPGLSNATVLQRVGNWYHGTPNPGLSDQNLLHWMALSPSGGSQKCQHIQYDANGRYTGMCTNPCIDGWVWCSQHPRPRVTSLYPPLIGMQKQKMLAMADVVGPHNPVRPDNISEPIGVLTPGSGSF